MPAPDPHLAPRHRTALSIAATLAGAAAVITYLPLLSVLLPLKVERLAGSARIDLITLLAIVGGVSASIANIAFGWWSDRRLARGGRRRRAILAGLVATVLSYGAIMLATTATTIILAVIAFQVAVNAVLAPFFALLADEVPPTQRGLIGGLLSLGPPFASLLGAGLVGLNGLNEAARLALVPLVAIVLFVPLLRLPALAATVAALPDDPVRPSRRDLAIISAGRMLVQIGGVVLSLYLLYYFESIAPKESALRLAGHVATLLTVGYFLPLPLAILVGRWSDRLGRRKPLLVATAIVAASGIAGMALARDIRSADIAFALYGAGSSVFLALHTGFSFQILPSAAHRGRDLGLYNLSNTVPALIGPVLTWWLSTPNDFAPLLLVIAALTVAGGLSVLLVRGRR